MALPASNLPAIASLMAARPSLAPRVRAALEAGAPGLDEIGRSFAVYLDAEKALGRIVTNVETESYGSSPLAWCLTADV